MSAGRRRRCVLALSLARSLAPVLGRLLRSGTDPEELLGLSAHVLAERLDVSQAAAEKVVRELKTVDAAREEARLRSAGVWITSLADEDYPAALASAPSPPALLYVKGEIPREPAVAVVGSRRATAYGLAAAEKLGRELAEAEVTVVSGYALGIDFAAHKAAVDAGGSTIAVLGCGLDVSYPRQHGYFADSILESGCFVSELPLGTPPLKQHFPARNRIISGLGMATVVVEAGRNSGSLYTADFALAQGREVLAVPGSIYAPLCAGTNALLADGAGPARGAEDILDAIGVEAPERAKAKLERLSKVEAEILGFLGAEALGIDELTGRSAREAAEVSTALTLLEMKALVRRGLDQRYVATCAR